MILGMVLVLLVIAYKRATRHYGYLESLGIPVVKPFLCFGSTPTNYHEIDFHELDMKWYRELGKPKTWGYYEGHMPTISTMDPNMIKSIFVKNFDAFRERLTPSLKIPHKYLTLDMTAGEEWKSLRKFLSPTFTSGRLKRMVQPIENQVDKLISHIRGRMEKDVVDLKRCVMILRYVNIKIHNLKYYI